MLNQVQSSDFVSQGGGFLTITKKKRISPFGDFHGGHRSEVISPFGFSPFGSPFGFGGFGFGIPVPLGPSGPSASDQMLQNQQQQEKTGAVYKGWSYSKQSLGLQNIAVGHKISLVYKDK